MSPSRPDDTDCGRPRGAGQSACASRVEGFGCRIRQYGTALSRLWGNSKEEVPSVQWCHPCTTPRARRLSDPPPSMFTLAPVPSKEMVRARGTSGVGSITSLTPTHAVSDNSTSRRLPTWRNNTNVRTAAGTSDSSVAQTRNPPGPKDCTGAREQAANAAAFSGREASPLVAL